MREDTATWSCGTKGASVYAMKKIYEEVKRGLEPSSPRLAEWVASQQGGLTDTWLCVCHMLSHMTKYGAELLMGVGGMP